jgi:hypothetical protein
MIPALLLAVASAFSPVAAQPESIVRTAPPKPMSAADWQRYRRLEAETRRRLAAGDPLGALTLTRSRDFKIAVCAMAAEAFLELDRTAPDEAKAFSVWAAEQQATATSLDVTEARQARELLDVLSMTGMGLSEDAVRAAGEDGLMALYFSAIAERCRSLVDEPGFDLPER